MNFRRFVALLVCLPALTSSAQEVWGEPPLVSTAENVTAAQCETSSDCAAGSVCFSGTCQQSCSTKKDCSAGAACVGHRKLPDGRWTKGACEGKATPGSPSLLRERGPNGEERYKAGRDVPAGYHLVTQPRWSLVAGGVAALTAGYGISVAIAALSGDALGAVPFIGTIMMAASGWSSLGGGSGAFDRFFEVMGKTLVVLGCVVDVAAQIAGLVMIISGGSLHASWLERDDGKPSISFVPSGGGGLVGASVVGRF